MLNLVSESAFFLPSLMILTQQVIEPVSMVFALPPQFTETVVDAFRIRFHPKQFLLGGVVDELRWSDLLVCLILAVIKHNGRRLLFHTEVNGQDTILHCVYVIFGYVYWHVKRVAVFRRVEGRCFQVTNPNQFVKPRMRREPNFMLSPIMVTVRGE